MNVDLTQIAGGAVAGIILAVAVLILLLKALRMFLVGVLLLAGFLLATNSSKLPKVAAFTQSHKINR